ncbi:MAG: hypothetical protein MI741_13075, partial [Rhodospirillales bacterium]|nr:hypothetical protein [Rhodospirillales bacterium]
FVGNLGEQYTSLTPDQTLELGDFDGDLAVGHSDFVMFRDAYEAIHGAGSFALVPEPVTLGLVLPSLLLVGRRVRGGRAQ